MFDNTVLVVPLRSIAQKWCRSEAPSSGALFGSDRGERRPALLDFFTAAVWAQHLAFFVVHQRQNLVEEFLAFLAEEFVVGHADLSRIILR